MRSTRIGPTDATKRAVTAPGPTRSGRRPRALGPQGERTRRRLLEAAKAAFRERGFAATRVDDITRRAGTSHGAFYLYFGSKQDVLEVLALETADEMYRLADALEGIEAGEEGFRRLRDWVATFVDTYDEHAPVITAWTQASENPRFNTLGRRVLGNFAGKIAAAIDRHPAHDRRIDPAVAATALIAMMERLCYYWLVRGPRFRREPALDTLGAILYEGIFGADGRAASRASS